MNSRGSFKILGIDPGSRIIGHAIIESRHNKFVYLDSGMKNFSSIEDFPSRLNQIFFHIQNLVTQWRPDHIALEGLIYVKSPLAIIKLAQARGAMLAAVAQTHCGKIFEYSPNLVKRTASGHGHATKENIQLILGKMLGKENFESMDESDALAVAICHAFHLTPQNAHLPANAFQANKNKSKRGLASSLAHALKDEKR